MNALFLQDLAQKTHRGLRGRVEAGKSAGGRCYGYDIVRRTDERGELIRGDRSVNPTEAVIVNRIFTMFAGGASPIAIAKCH
jgi:site-specific DNA recombinase